MCECVRARRYLYATAALARFMRTPIHVLMSAASESRMAAARLPVRVVLVDSNSIMSLNVARCPCPRVLSMILMGPHIRRVLTYGVELLFPHDRRDACGYFLARAHGEKPALIVLWCCVVWCVLYTM